MRRQTVSRKLMEFPRRRIRCRLIADKSTAAVDELRKNYKGKRPAFCQYLGLRVRGRGIISPTPNSIRNILNEWNKWRRGFNVPSFMTYQEYDYVVHVIWMFLYVIWYWLIARTLVFWSRVNVTPFLIISEHAPNWLYKLSKDLYGCYSYSTR